MRHDDDGLDKGRRSGILRHFFHERAIHFHSADRILPQIRKRRVAGTEIIEREMHPELCQPPERRARGLVREHAFGKLQL